MNKQVTMEHAEGASAPNFDLASLSSPSTAKKSRARETSNKSNDLTTLPGPKAESTMAEKTSCGATESEPELLSEEVFMMASIASAWHRHRGIRSSLKASREEKQATEAQLAKQLSDLEQSLSRRGCLGKWSAFLKENGISRATADRHVNKYERNVSSSDPSKPLPNSQTPVEKAHALASRLLPSIRRGLEGDAAVAAFLKVIGDALVIEPLKVVATLEPA